MTAAHQIVRLRSRLDEAMKDKDEDLMEIMGLVRSKKLREAIEGSTTADPGAAPTVGEDDVRDAVSKNRHEFVNKIIEVVNHFIAVGGWVVDHIRWTSSDIVKFFVKLITNTVSWILTIVAVPTYILGAFIGLIGFGPAMLNFVGALITGKSIFTAITILVNLFGPPLGAILTAGGIVILAGLMTYICIAVGLWLGEKSYSILYLKERLINAIDKWFRTSS